MAQPAVVVLMIAMTATVGGLIYMHANREESQPQAEAQAPRSGSAKTASTVISAGEAVKEANGSPVDGAIDEPAQPPAPPSAPTDIARLVADTQSDDAKTRAEAIAALANAPKAQALPALERVLESGDPQVDRQIALRSLHTLALNDGDENGAIRNTIRQAVYHSEDESVSQNAQALLEDIEAAFDERGGGAR